MVETPSIICRLITVAAQASELHNFPDAVHVASEVHVIAHELAIFGSCQKVMGNVGVNEEGLDGRDSVRELTERWLDERQRTVVLVLSLGIGELRQDGVYTSRLQ